MRQQSARFQLTQATDEEQKQKLEAEIAGYQSAIDGFQAKVDAKAAVDSAEAELAELRAAVVHDQQNQFAKGLIARIAQLESALPTLKQRQLDVGLPPQPQDDKI